jgi:quinol monooxygenase YgiN
VTRAGALGALATRREDTRVMFEATARLTIRDGDVEGFKQQAAEVMRHIEEADDRPLRYDWVLSEDGTQCEVREAYVDADALLAHQRLVAEAKKTLMRDFVESHTMVFYGEPSPALSRAMDAMGVTFTQFSFFQGLSADIPVLHELPA